MKRILFVCLGNICRSPAAEAIFATMVERQGLNSGFSWDSAGTGAYHQGEPADPRMGAALKEHGYQSSSLARQVKATDFQEFDFILAMDRQNFRDLQVQQPANSRARLELMLEYGDSETEEVPDPYWGGEQGFHQVIKLLENAVDDFISKVKN